MLDLVISGATGRMGQAIARLAGVADDLRVVGGIARESARTATPGAGETLPVEAAGDLIRRGAVLVDFSAPSQLGSILDLHGDALRGRALVVGTTGLDAELERRLERVASSTAVLSAANFSVGVNLLLGLVRTAARALDAASFDVEIVEAHHAGKEDAPSGTALALARAVAEARGVSLEEVRRDGRSGRKGPRRPGEIALHALRGGDVVGEHTVHFLGDLERITLGHGAHSRDLFARGALVGARWLAGRPPGRYAMADVLGLAD